MKPSCQLVVNTVTASLCFNWSRPEKWGLLLCILSLFCPSVIPAAELHVGPGKTYTNISDVPWEGLAAGDTVFIHARSTPYAEKWILNRAGTANAPITVSGVADDDGNLPVIIGEGATTRSQLNYWNEDRGILKIGGSNKPADGIPSYIVVENLHFQRARGTFTGRNGASTYNKNAAGIYVEKGEHITIRNCTLSDNGNGLFVASATSDITVEGNYIYGNGNVGSIYEHNTYTEALNIVYQYNHFGPLCSGCGGNNLKDRSAGTIIRYNWIESGNRQLDLVDAEGSDTLVNNPAYQTTFVYGNILIEPDGAGNSQIVHFGGDSGTTSIYRNTLYLWNNTVVSTRSGNTTILRLSTNGQTAYLWNNILYVTAAGNRLALLDSAGTLFYGGNLFKLGLSNSHSGLTGSITDAGGNLTAASPGFINELQQDFSLPASSPARNSAVPLPGNLASVYPLDRQYLKQQNSTARFNDGIPDIGAYEYSHPDRTLAINITGKGAVTASSTTSSMTCQSNCNGTFPDSTSVTLTATAEYGNFFNGWSNNCTGSSNCSIDMDQNKTVTATFNLIPRARSAGQYFGTLGSAYAAVAANGVIEVKNAVFYENLVCNRGINFTLKGGYSDDFLSSSGFTTLAGSLIIASGSSIVDKLIIK